MVDNTRNASEQENRLADELAARLGDPDGAPRYEKYVERFSEGYIRKVLGQVLEVPAEKIRTSRAALFTWLMEHNGKGSQTKDKSANPRY